MLANHVEEMRDPLCRDGYLARSDINPLPSAESCSCAEYHGIFRRLLLSTSAFASMMGILFRFVSSPSDYKSEEVVLPLFSNLFSLGSVVVFFSNPTVVYTFLPRIWVER